MLACPACKKRSFSRSEIVGAGLDGGVRCPSCGQVARLDQMSRCLVACVLAVLLWIMLLYGNLFYSGYLFVFSTIAILAGWPLLLAAALPLLALEKSPGGKCFDRKQSMAMFAILIVAAIVIDGLLSYRSAADRADANTMSAGVNAR
jgi:hypothetical protein